MEKQSEKKIILGVIGCGFVGGTVFKAFRDRGVEVRTYDPKLPDTKIEDVLEAQVCFVCVPTPTLSGACDTTILRSVFQNLASLQYRGVVCHKCTVIPGTTNALAAEFSELQIVHNPEFLRERHAYSDFVNQPVALISGSAAALQAVDQAYHEIGIPTKRFVSFLVTEYAKYLHNTFLALKVAFANEFSWSMKKNHDLSFGVDWDTIVAATASQGGIGEGHWKVPGPDGQRGFGGSCFPKDVRALLTFDPDLTILKSAWKLNQVIRPHDENCKPIAC